MSAIQQTALKRAFSYLAAAGAQYVVLHDGKQYGDLKLPRAKTNKSGRFDHAGKHEYTTKLPAAAIGDVVTVLADSRREGQLLQQTIAMYCTKKWGPDSALVETTKTPDGWLVSVLIVSKG